MKHIKFDEGKFLQRKNDLKLFEDDEKLIFIAEKNMCPHFCFGSQSKKRPNSITFGRIFNSKILEMFEFILEDVKGNHI